jgi:hypothetical protein
MTAPRPIPQDHLKPAAQIEAEGGDGGTAEITLGEAVFTIPADIDDVDAEFLKFTADGDAYRMVFALLDAKQAARLKALKPKIRDLNVLAEQMATIYGFESAGN